MSEGRSSIVLQRSKPGIATYEIVTLIDEVTLNVAIGIPRQNRVQKTDLSREIINTTPNLWNNILPTSVQTTFDAIRYDCATDQSDISGLDVNRTAISISSYPITAASMTSTC